ncbi:MAG TPA: GNAT family N-acetyltransferase [Afifellaceae bacterium]|nr:GNAT family N-acetyltransferase [Afifellaceae bacterium]
MPDDVHIRPARKADAAALAVLIDMAGEGMASWVWSDMAKGHETAFEVGRMRAGRGEGAFSYRNAFVLTEQYEGAEEVAGMVLGYRLDDPYVMPDLADIPAPFRPLAELEAEVPGAWYLNAMAVFADFRGRGFGARLLETAENLARQSGAREIALIWAEENNLAAGLYKRFGYAERARRPIVPFPAARIGGDWVLLAKPPG